MKNNQSPCEKKRKRRLEIVSIGTAVLALLVPLQARAQTDPIQTNVPALKTVYAKDFTIGCILSYKHIGFPSDHVVPGQSEVIDPNGGYLVKFHMNSMSPGNNMKQLYTVDINASAAAYDAASAADKDYADTHPVVRFNGDIIAQLNWQQEKGSLFADIRWTGTVRRPVQGSFVRAMRVRERV